MRQITAQKMISAADTERLLCFTNNSGPAFITATVCAAVLNNASAGLYMLFLQYGLSLLYGIISARFCPADILCPKAEEIKTADRLPTGLLLKNAAVASVNKIVTIGCFIIFFSLLCSILEKTGIFSLAAGLLQLTGISEETGRALLYGITEMTLGINEAAALNTDFPHIFALCAFFLSFGGFSVHMQVYAMIAERKLNFKPYLFSCLLKALAAYPSALLLSRIITVQSSTLQGSGIICNNTILFMLTLFLFFCSTLKGRNNKS